MTKTRIDRRHNNNINAYSLHKCSRAYRANLDIMTGTRLSCLLIRSKDNKVIWQSPPNSSFVFARQQHKTDGLAEICNFTFWLGVRPQISWGQGPPSNTMCYWTPRVYLPNGIQIRRTVHECDRRQTDHATKKCIGIGGIACTARAIPPKSGINSERLKRWWRWWRW